jgi:uncharacterized secreted protein with C-terminal beta-propeller domain
MSRTATLSAVQLAAIVAVALVAGGVGAVMLEDVATPDDQAPNATEDGPAVSTFDSAAAFRTYLSDADQARGFTAGAATARAGGDAAASDDREVEDGADAEPVATAAPQDTPVETAVEAGGNGNGAGPDAQRASDTNVQVEGIDEPDILKTTPQTAYYAPSNRPRVVHDDDRRDGTADEGVRLVNVSDPAAPEVASRLEVSGRLLLSGDSLVVFQGGRILGYDVSDRENPERVWEKELSDRVVTARLHDGTVYLVTESHVDRREPCPVEPMEDVTVPCTEIHHPTEPTPVDTTYTVTLLDPADGTVHDTASFVGAGGRSVVYVSTDRVYVTYPQQVDRAEMMAQFLLENQSDRLDQQARDRIREIQGYDLSPRATRIEIQRAIEAWLARLDESEREATEQNLQDDLRAWAADNKRQFERTGIVAFEISESGDAPTVEAGATGSVPGHPLNQFSLDEHDGEFRIATTVSGAMGTDSANDLYVLDQQSLDRTGAVQGMGITERIYSVRYVGDEAYVVTFRRIDPFHVVDLSDPQNPTLEGELKLPGFSSYLHPLPGDRVLGIGEEEGKVKLVVFDVSNPENPTIETDTILDARWSAVADSHHAFLMDRRHGVFFLPAGEEAYVYNYTGGLEVETTVATDGRVHRTAYVGDYLYVYGDNSITVVDERDWERADTVELSE